MNTEQRRLLLRLLAKLMLLVFIIGLLAVFVRSLPGYRVQDQVTHVNLKPLQAEQLLRYDWNGKRVLVLKRGAIDPSELQTLESELLDPYSRHATQPDTVNNVLRSVTREYFIALDYGTDLNCQLDYLSRDKTGPEGRVWLGGFRDRCRGSWYDQAGRVYNGQQAKRNLPVPSYQIQDNTLILDAE
ncbi:MAG: ubiquinol-cytochrome C reductase, iron-sulfur subunit [Gammaproteobacteria bacterium]|nr:ubiquinol-cytochrome C reductase, iron-sulfur subunit [Gammaproteobacteria bacterium]